MMIYSRLEEALSTDNIDEKDRLVEEVSHYCSTSDPSPVPGFVPRRFTVPSYAARCRVVAPRDLPRRKDPGTPEGLAILLHAIAHIEYSAVDLAIDAVYRFPDMPRAYRLDWLEVAQDEIRHFRMLESLLGRLGCRYGDYPVHRGLFDAADHTAGDVLERMAVIPRHYEATGLDVNPRIIARLEAHRADPVASDAVEALKVIYDEEIDHVRKGDRWFRYLCKRRGLDPATAFFEVLERHRLLNTRRLLNVPARQEAGFRCEELKRLGAADCEEL